MWGVRVVVRFLVKSNPRVVVRFLVKSNPRVWWPYPFHLLIFDYHSYSFFLIFTLMFPSVCVLPRLKPGLQSGIKNVSIIRTFLRPTWFRDTFFFFFPKYRPSFGK